MVGEWIESEVWVLSRAKLAMHLHVQRFEIFLIIIFVPNIQPWVHEVLTFRIDKCRSVDANYDLFHAAWESNLPDIALPPVVPPFRPLFPSPPIQHTYLSS